ncbi:arylsulfatase [Microlunatus soli]|uniref:Arylsulfatase n=1 Tax=Microlunatus soli TaxID=630515 RepID=A0A1H2A5T4_9ACTN|nr:arylsulfatase [Microlunatus soli]SDT41274.1 arylsulfatase [Microlunatus soli]
MTLPRRRLLGLSALGVGGALAGCSAPGGVGAPPAGSPAATGGSGSPSADPGATSSPTAGQRPNVVLILADDMGFSDIGCYGSEIATPHLDRLAAGGVRMSQFYNTARCSPSRASLLTGLHPHQTGIGVLNKAGEHGYPGTLNRRCLTLAELLGDAGYATSMFGKWHLTAQVAKPDDSWPQGRGFDHHYGIIGGASSYFEPAALYADSRKLDPPQDFYLTTELGRRASEFVHDQVHNRPDQPFFLYLPFTAPHWPLHAPERWIKLQAGHYRAGWDTLRQQRYRRLVDSGMLSGRWKLGQRDPRVQPYDTITRPQWQQRRMEVYAAQIAMMDAAVGQLVEALTRTKQLDNTLIIFLSDNGGSAEELQARIAQADDSGADSGVDRRRTGSDPAAHRSTRVRRGNDPTIVPGPATTYSSYGRGWAGVSNTPFREYKHWVHEGGISTPLIAHWPGRLPAGRISHHPHQLTDVMATVLDVTGLRYPASRAGRPLTPIEGRSMINSWLGRPEADRNRLLYWEHEGNCAVRQGRWKLVRKFGGPWELYDIDADRTELHDLAAAHRPVVQHLAAAYQAWAKRCGVHPWVIERKGRVR